MKIIHAQEKKKVKHKFPETWQLGLQMNVKPRRWDLRPYLSAQHKGQAPWKLAEHTNKLTMTQWTGATVFTIVANY